MVVCACGSVNRVVFLLREAGGSLACCAFVCRLRLGRGCFMSARCIVVGRKCSARWFCGSLAGLGPCVRLGVSCFLWFVFLVSWSGWFLGRVALVLVFFLMYGFVAWSASAWCASSWVDLVFALALLCLGVALVLWRGWVLRSPGSFLFICDGFFGLAGFGFMVGEVWVLLGSFLVFSPWCFFVQVCRLVFLVPSCWFWGVVVLCWFGSSFFFFFWCGFGFVLDFLVVLVWLVSFILLFRVDIVTAIVFSLASFWVCFYFGFACGPVFRYFVLAFCFVALRFPFSLPLGFGCAVSFWSFVAGFPDFVLFRFALFIFFRVCLLGFYYFVLFWWAFFSVSFELFLCEFPFVAFWDILVP